MNDVNRLLSLLDERPLLFSVAVEKFGGSDSVGRVVNAARKECRNLAVGRTCDGTWWIFKGEWQRKDENMRIRIREALLPLVMRGEPFSHSEMIDVLDAVGARRRGPIEQIMKEFGYYCDEDADWVEEREGDWYRFVGYEMPEDIRRTTMREVKALLEHGVDREDAWNLLVNAEYAEGLTREWFDRCWDVGVNGQRGVLGND